MGDIDTTTTRRTFLRGIGATATVLATSSLRRASAVTRPTVAVLGGGVAGLTAAHELAQRGFDVTVYERRALGGKARSLDVAGSATGGRRPLPGEHGFRIEFGFYDNLPDTLRRIPFGANPRGVWDNLVPAPLPCVSRAGQRDIPLPIGAIDPTAYTSTQLRELVLAALLQLDLPPLAVLHLADRLTVYMSSCDTRRIDQWENTSAREFLASERYGGDYRRVFAEFGTHFLQASTSDLTSAEFLGWVLESFVYSTLGRTDGPAARVLDAPTNEAWIDPWSAELRRLGVRMEVGTSVDDLVVDRGRIVAANATRPGGSGPILADWFVCALPVERARRLWNPAVLAADPGLAAAGGLETDWMNGIQFYLRERTPLSKGHMIYADAPWAVSSISQAQFWSRDFASTYGDGQVHDCISAVISDWNAPGPVFRRPARECSPEEIARETWVQMQQHVNDSGQPQLPDALLHSWHLDPGLIQGPAGLESEDPLVLPRVGSWAHRPEVGTRLPNLVLAGDYTRGDHQLANMEAANESGRRAANVILERSGSGEPPVKVIPRLRPPEWDALKKIDERRHGQGKPNLFDVIEVDRALTRAVALPTRRP